MAPPFDSSYQHLLAHLERVDLLIRSRVAHFRRFHAVDAQFRGLYITDAEVDGLLQQPLGQPAWLRTGEADWLAVVDRALEESAAQLRARTAATFRLARVQSVFGLSAFEVDVLLICLASELDSRYERLYGYLQDDVTRKKPGIELVIQLVCRTQAARLEARGTFHVDNPLLRHRLVQVADKEMTIDTRIAQYLLGCDRPDERICNAVTPVAPQLDLDSLRLDDRTRQALQNAWNGNGPVLVLKGPPGAGKRSVAEALLKQQHRTLLVVDASATEEWVLIDREATLTGSALLWKNTVKDNSAWAKAVDASNNASIVSTAEDLDLPGLFPRRGALCIKFPETTYTDRRSCWTEALSSYPSGVKVDVGSIASRFKLTPGQIKRAAASASHLARVHGGADGQITQRELLEACRLHSNQKLSGLARKIPPHHRWQDMVLPPDCIGQLREICNQVRFRERVYGEWGFGHKLALGKGLTAMFSGPSGTGKTMAAGVIAGELGLDLFRIDLSTVVSKYIGETEKNLAQIFAEAETSNAILFFDEADALFGKRSEVRDSHDRYANIEVGFLLQRMEEYEGMAILATNLRKNLDDAFMRRLHFAVEFPFPDAEQRLRIWQGIWPADTPRSAHLDLHALSGRYEMTGGNIKNAAVAAAFLAADDDRPVGVEHILRAIDREYQKVGKLMLDGDDLMGDRP